METTIHHRYFLLNKPYKVVSVFISAHRKKITLDQIGISFPEGVHAVGRLDENSEGLLILTTDSKVDQIMLSPKSEIEKEYWVQVQGHVTEEKLQELRTGVVIRINTADYKTLPCKAEFMDEPKGLWPRKKHPVSPTLKNTWIRLVLTEGKYHQVRKMTATIGHQTLRLIRGRIGALELGEIKNGEVREISAEEMFQKLELPLSKE